jgi:hypothetical protein
MLLLPQAHLLCGEKPGTVMVMAPPDKVFYSYVTGDLKTTEVTERIRFKS